MKQGIAASFASSTLFLLASALASEGHSHGDKHQSQYGGVVTEVETKQYELVARPDSIVIYVDDHGRKVDTKGATAKVTLLNGGDKTEAALSPAGANRLEAKGAFKVAPGTRAVAVVTLAGQPARSMRFSVK